MELNERICRAILRDAWERARGDGDEYEMPPFPSNVHPEYKSYTVERTYSEGDVFEKRTPCMMPAYTIPNFYQDYLREVINAAPWEWED